jgi:TolA-binding protein
MNTYRILSAFLLLGFWSPIRSAEPSASEPGADKVAMVTEMQGAVNAVAIKHGNIPFTQIFTNEPQRATAVRKRFMEIERSDTLQKQIDEMEARAKTLQETIQNNEAVAADLERKITARKVELASLTPAPAETVGK